MKLNDAKTLATVEISADMDADQLETLLRKLALLRASMQPAVPHTRKQVLDGCPVLLEQNPGLVMEQMPAGGISFGLRHIGYGWLFFQLDDRTATGMHDYLARNIRPEIALARKHIGSTH